MQSEPTPLAAAMRDSWEHFASRATPQAKEEWLVAALIAAHERIAELEERFNLHGHETVSRSGGFTSGTPKQVARRL